MYLLELIALLCVRVEGAYCVFIGADSTALGEGGRCLLCIYWS